MAAITQIEQRPSPIQWSSINGINCCIISRKKKSYYFTMNGVQFCWCSHIYNIITQYSNNDVECHFYFLINGLRPIFWSSSSPPPLPSPYYYYYYICSLDNFHIHVCAKSEQCAYWHEYECFELNLFNQKPMIKAAHSMHRDVKPPSGRRPLRHNIRCNISYERCMNVSPSSPSASSSSIYPNRLTATPTKK